MENKNQDISVNVKLSKDDYIEMNITYLKAGRKKKATGKVSFIFAAVILILLMVAGITSVISGGSFSEASIAGIRLVALLPAFILAAVFLILYAFYKYGFPAIIKRYWNNNFDKDQSLQKEAIYEISPDGIKIQSDAELKLWRYNEIYKVQETKKHLFIYESEDTANIIPKHCFSRVEDISAAVHLFKEKLPSNKFEAY